MQPADLAIAFEAPAAGGGFAPNILLLVAFVGIFYFVLLRPQQKEAKEHAALVASLQKGDKVVTASGIHGKVHEAKDGTLVLEISPNAYLTVDREAVKRKLEPPKGA
ncbi:MAG: preprotein translocase subunit YajC [Myxococcota bacterium]